ncbi:MAG: tRNA threonylcarbamoyladenosine biosynthesis protein TsaB [Pseudonocardiales bacterium]|nr:tRNA threonylcarbamoyladenosine biosynthesis protein TsaB [Pseudonocardiales bacterium]
MWGRCAGPDDASGRLGRLVNKLNTVLVLAIDTSTAAVTAGVVDLHGEPVVRAEQVHINARGHAELLAPAIAACLSVAGTTPRELAAIVAGAGPGPYTGLRVGLVTAAVLAEALAIPAYGVGSLDAIALANPGTGELLVASDARRREVYWARYDADGDRTTGPGVAAAADVPLGAAAAMAGAGARSYRDAFGLPQRPYDYPTAAALAARAAGRIRAGAPGEVLQPCYLRRPDAVAPGPAKRVSP